ncbi:MAG: hypothetical protein ACK4GU_10005 [Alishewanella aestuarii]
MKSNKTPFLCFLMIIVLILLLTPNVAEAGRGGSRSGTLWWIPLVIVGGVIYFLNKNVPDFWGVIFMHIVLLFVACFGVVFLKWAGIIEQEDMLISIPVVFIIIIIALRAWDKNKQMALKNKNKQT